MRLSHRAKAAGRTAHRATPMNGHGELAKALLHAAVTHEGLGAMAPLEVCDAVEVTQASLRQLLLRLEASVVVCDGYGSEAVVGAGIAPAARWLPTHHARDKSTPLSWARCLRPREGQSAALRPRCHGGRTTLVDI
jgi:hypothetical protein